MVYHIAGGNTDPRVPLKHEEILEPVDGDYKLITLVDALDEHGNHFSFHEGGAGRPVDPTHMPTRLRRKGNKGLPLHDMREIWGKGLLVNQTFKDIVEGLEPNVHQFFPMAIEQDGKVIFERYYFHICNYLDALAKDKCVPPVAPGRIYMPTHDGNDRVVFDTQKVGKHHAWNDHSTIGRFVSNELLEALQSAELTGLGYTQYDES